MYKIIRGNFLIEQARIQVIFFPKIQMGTRMTRMLRSADLHLEIRGICGVNKNNMKCGFSQRRRGAKVFEMKGLEIWEFENWGMGCIFGEKLVFCVNLCEI
jgi:hypothetical protein